MNEGKERVWKRDGESKKKQQQQHDVDESRTHTYYNLTVCCVRM